MKPGVIIALVAVVALALIARGCSERKDNAAMKVETANNAAAGDKAQPAEFSLSAKDDEGFDLPEREEIRQKRKLTPGMEVYVVGGEDWRVDTDHTQVFVIGINGKVKVETADTDAAEVLIVRSARKREDLQRQKVEISPEHKDEYLSIHFHVEGDNSPDSLPEIRQRVVLRLPRQAGLEIREVGGNVTVGEISGHLKLAGVTGNVRVARAAGTAVVGNVDGAGYITGVVDITFAPLNASVIRLYGVNGDVNLRFEGEVNADLTTRNVIGAIKLDFPNAEMRESEPVWGGLKARMGNGGSLIELHNIKGNVTLSKVGNRNASAAKAVAK